MNDIPIIVMTSDHYLKALRPFAWLFRKYWSSTQKVTVVGFAQPSFGLPDNFNFVSLGSMQDFPINKWSDGLIDYLEARSDITHFILFFEDYWLTRPVDLVAVKMLYDYCLQFRNVLKMDLVSDRLYAKGAKDYNNCGRLDLIISDRDSQYLFSLMCGIWSRELMLRFLQRNWTPWDCELSGTPRVAFADDTIVLGTRNLPVRHTLAHRGGNPGELLLSELKPIDVIELTNLGYIPY